MSAPEPASLSPYQLGTVERDRDDADRARAAGCHNIGAMLDTIADARERGELAALYAAGPVATGGAS